jgi:proline dehydrogenase
MIDRRAMSRKLFLALSKIKWAQPLISKLPFTRRAARRFVAGEKLSEAVEAVKNLNASGIKASLDFLGEDTRSAKEAQTATNQLIEVLDKIQTNNLKANLSVKLSQIGLTLDEELCRQNLAKILTQAAIYNIFVRIDMEDSSLTEKTISTFEWALQNGHTNTGIVIQAYLYRSQEDIQRLGLLHAKIRLCKGAYNEPPEVAFAKKADVNANYDRLAADLLEIARNDGFPPPSLDGKTPPIPAFASHDPARIESVIQLMRLMQVPEEAIEFQLLYGIRRDLQLSLVNQGYPVRVYTPFGTQWYAYFMRRLAERPANVKFFLSNSVKR